MEKQKIIEYGLWPEEDIISFFKTNEDSRCKLNFIYTILVKKQRYALAKLFKNKIEILDYLESIKNETLEEAAENEWKKYKYSDILYVKTFKDGFLTGTKWQQERSYSEEEVIEVLDNFRNSNETDLIKWFNLNKK